MTLLPLLAVLLLGGDPIEPQAARAIERLCPCPSGDVTCQAQHRRAARAIGAATTDQDAAVRLVGLGCHESRFAVVVQALGPAVTWWQLEVPAAERVELLADDVLAARKALAARAGGLQAYACGGGCPEKAAELAAFELGARWAWATR